MASRNRRHGRRGFTLVEILIVIVILGLIMAMATLLLRSVSVTQKRSVTAARMANVEAALVQFVMQQKRLPCPADGTQPTSTGGAEMWAGGTCTTQQNGAEWQARTYHRIDEQRHLDRHDALREMLRRYIEHMHSNEPVHTWPLD